jgi:hypothetical protein
MSGSERIERKATNEPQETKARDEGGIHCKILS